VDLCAEEMGNNVKAGVALLGDIGAIVTQALALKGTLPMNYYTVFHHISQLLPHDCIIVSEGANTMDIGRTMLNNYLPRHRAPPVSLLPEARYDEVMTAFGGRGFLVRTTEELRDTLQLSLDDWERPSLLNVLIDPSSDRKQQVYEHLCNNVD
ncbi:hypothetical protein GOODEAATRI_030448, partial [Goodea atripinnis]